MSCFLPVMLRTSLIRLQCFSVLMEAQQRKVVAFAPLDGVRDGGPADDEALVFDAGQGFEGFEFADECGFVVFRDVGAELE